MVILALWIAVDLRRAGGMSRITTGRRLLLMSLLLFAMAGTVFIFRTLVPAFRYAALRMEYNREVHAIQHRIEKLQIEKPVTRDEHAWNGAISWLGVASGNVFFTPESVPLDRVKEYHRDLVHRLGESNPWTLTDTRWAWNRYRAAGPAGERYLVRCGPGFEQAAAISPETRPGRP